MARGWFITFEGGEGTGKSTQLDLLAHHLEERGVETVRSREPGGTALAEAVRSILLDPRQDPDGLSELLLLEAARHDHVERVVRPALQQGSVVLCDRFADSSVVYQGVARGVGETVVEELNRLATGGLEPDRTLVLDLDPAAALKRARTRNVDARLDESRLDNEPDAFHRRVRQGFLSLAQRNPDRVRVVNAHGSAEEVHRRVLQQLPGGLK